MRTHSASHDLHSGHGFGETLGLGMQAVARQFAHLGEVWHEIRERSAAMEELASLSDEELADIGVTRSMIPHLFDKAHQH